MYAPLLYDHVRLPVYTRINPLICAYQTYQDLTRLLVSYSIMKVFITIPQRPQYTMQEITTNPSVCGILKSANCSTIL